jgi:cation diffusion facilitator CzcD-associated flavoprotein CzcO
MDKYDVRRRTRLNTKVVGATFDDDHHHWVLETADGDRITARFVVGATGVFTKPQPPSIPGLEDFGGTVMHTARWDHGVDLSGKRVAIVGTGASAVQVIPSIAPEVGHLTVFQRTPIWCLPKPDGDLGGPVGFALRRLPGAKRVSRLVSQVFVELNFPLPAHYNRVLRIASAGERLGLRHLERSVHDPVIREKLTPTYSLGCKRPGFSNDYLSAFNRENVLLETDPIAAITPTGVRTRSGTAHQVDILILATGFKVFEVGNMPPFPIRGADGLDLEEFWGKNRFQAYQGVSVPGFPNFFSILGPYGYNGSSYFNLIETQTHHIVRLLRRAKKVSATRVEIRPEANAEYFESMLARRKNQVFFQGGCGDANSYYFDVHGDVPFRPAPTLETMWTSRRFDLDHYEFAAA